MRTTNQNGAGTSDEQEQEPGVGTQKVQVTPHWNAIGGLVAIGVLYALLPDKVSIGPRWSLLAIEAVFIIPFVFAVITRRSISPVTLRVGSLVLLGIVTIVLAIGIVHMISTLKTQLNGFGLLIHRAAVIWMQHSHIRFMVLGNRWGRSGKTSTGRPSTV